MAVLDPIQRNRFVQLFPELPAQYADLLLMHTLGMPAGNEYSRKKIQICKERLGLNTIHELRCVVLA
jgi:hypothetical protein